MGIVTNWLNFDIKHIFNDMEMLSLTLKELNGFPRLEITGTMLALQPILPAGVFKTEVIVNNWFNYDIKHVFNNMEMLNIVFKMLNGFPRLVITGTMPTLPLVPAGVFKTEMIVSDWVDYEIKHIFNDKEMLSMTLKMLKGFPRLEITGTMPTLPLLPVGVFKTEVIANNWLNYEIKHIFDDMEMLNLTLKELTGCPRLEITGTMPTLPILPAGVFKTEVTVNNWFDFEMKHIFNKMEMLNIVFKMLNGLPMLEITGTMPTLPLLPAGVFKTEVIGSSRYSYEIKHIFNGMELLNLNYKMMNGFPRLEIAGTMPTLPILPAGVFKTEVIVNNWVDYEIKHIFNDMEM